MKPRIRFKAVSAALLTGILGVSLAGGAAHAEYTLNEFAVPGAASTSLWDVNNNGTIVGYSTDASGVATGFVLSSSGDITPLSGPAGAGSSYALGISDSGTVVGSASISGQQRGFVYSGGTYMLFDVAGANDTFLRGISPEGRYISGYYTTATQLGVAFIYDTTAGLLHIASDPTSIQTILQGINGSGIAAGSDILSGTPPTRVGFVYDITTGTRTEINLAGMMRTALRSIDDAGTLAGWFIDAAGQAHGFVGSPASYEQIDFAGADVTLVEGSNNNGVLVGQFQIGGIAHGFIARPFSTADRLQQLASDVAEVGSGRSLANKLALAQAYFDAGDIPSTCAMLSDFINEVRAQQGKKKLTSEQGEQLTADALALMEQLGCG